MTDKSPSLDDILIQASDWQARLWSEQATEQDHLACLAWRQANPLHEQAWQILQGFNQQFDEVPKPQQQVLLQQDNSKITDWIKKGSTFAVLLGLGYVVLQQDYLAMWTADYRSRTGEVKHIHLSDGTQLILASNSVASFDEDKRQIKLFKGQIFIETGHNNPDLSAIHVYSLDTTIEPLGTQFSIQNTKTQLAIAVYEGAVKISAPYIQPSMILNAGWQTQLGPGQQHIPQQPVNKLQLAWIQHKLVVEQMPLCDFLAEVANYRAGYINCSDDLQQYKVSGTYSLNNTNLILQQIVQTFPVQVNTYTNYLVTVNTRTSP